MNERKLKYVFDEAYKFLAESTSEEEVNKILLFYLKKKPEDMKNVFLVMIQSLRNKQGYDRFIADAREMDDILYDFNNIKVLETYSTWQELFLKLKKKFGKKYTMDINNKQNSWAMFSKGIMSIVKFLSNFNNVKEFDDFVNFFSLNEFTRAALPMLLEKEIFGFGFPLACNLLKELGYHEYGKPDVHLKDIFYNLELTENRDDYEVFKIIVRMAKAVNRYPTEIDKIFWLIGSGRIKIPEKNKNLGPRKKEFISIMKKKLLNL